MADTDIEQEILSKGKTAPRVTPEHIENIIQNEYYFTARDGWNGAIFKQSYVSKQQGKPSPIAEDVDHSALCYLTFCVLVLKNGYTVTGESACASPANFDAEIGKKIARQNAVNKIWQLEGYLLKQKLYEQSSDQENKLQTDLPPHQLRVLEELAQLSDRLIKLTAFIDEAGDVFRSLGIEEQSRLRRQAASMREYQGVLAERVASF